MLNLEARLTQQTNFRWITSAVIMAGVLPPAWGAQTDPLIPASDGFYDAWNSNRLLGPPATYTDVEEGVGCVVNAFNDYWRLFLGVGNRQSATLSIDSIPEGARITAVDITACIRDGLLGAAQFQMFVRIDASDTDSGANLSPQPSFEQSEVSQQIVVDVVKHADTTLEIGALKTADGELQVGTLSAIVTYEEPATLTIAKASELANPPVSFGFETNPAPAAADPDPVVLGVGETAELTLVPGEIYTVTESSAPGNWDLVDIVCDGAQSPSIDLDNRSVALSLSDGGAATCTFTNQRKPQLRVHKYDDLNGDGSRDDGEPDLAGWAFSLYEAESDTSCGSQIQRTKATSANGRVDFTSLAAETDVCVCETLQDGWVLTEPTGTFEGPDGAPQTCIIAPNLQYNEVRDLMFGNQQTSHVEPIPVPALGSWRLLLLLTAMIGMSGAWFAGRRSNWPGRR